MKNKTKMNYIIIETQEGKGDRYFTDIKKAVAYLKHIKENKSKETNRDI
jgi:hypothetical protein